MGLALSYLTPTSQFSQSFPFLCFLNFRKLLVLLSVHLRPPRPSSTLPRLLQSAWLLPSLQRPPRWALTAAQLHSALMLLWCWAPFECFTLISQPVNRAPHTQQSRPSPSRGGGVSHTDPSLGWGSGRLVTEGWALGVRDLASLSRALRGDPGHLARLVPCAPLLPLL